VKLQLAGFRTDSIVDGPGIRCTIYFQGCPHRCPGCHNPETHDPQGGLSIELKEIVAQIECCSGITGATFSGGEPFGQTAAATALAAEVNARGLNLVLYSGYTYENLVELSMTDLNCKNLLLSGWLLIDGPFMVKKQDLKLPYRGSFNQRIIDLKKSAAEGKAVEWKADQDG
jgi:anaerobic ribonucleoside-triphosphate reductase activating protein